MEPQALGAQNLLTRALGLRANDGLHLFVWNADEVARQIEEQATALGVRCTRTNLHALPNPKGSARSLTAMLRDGIGDAVATMMLASHGVPSAVSVAVIDAAGQRNCRHAHVVRVDPRMLAQSLRADPAVLRAINERILAVLGPPITLHVEGAGGTELEVLLTDAYRMTPGDGQPTAERWQTFPAGYVSTHPTRVRGTFVADRNLLAAEAHGLAPKVRKNPVRFVIEDSRVTRFSCDDAELSGIVQRYLASHPNAARVGLVLLPTNYLVRTEVGLESQDELVPGLNLALGFTSQAETGASYEAPVQLRLLARRLEVRARGMAIVEGGRLADRFVAGLDPFRG